MHFTPASVALTYQMMDLPVNHKKSHRLLKSDKLVMQSRGWLVARGDAFRAALLSRAVIRLFDEGEALYRYGDAADGLYCVIHGAVEVCAPADDGQEFVAHRDGAGFWVGDLAMLADETRLVSVTATEQSRMALVPTARIFEMLRETPDFYRDFYAITHANMRTALRILANMGVNGADRKMALRLLHTQETLAGADGWMNISQDQLAAMIGVSLPTSQRLLRGFSESGAVELGYGRLRIIDSKALTKLAES